MPGTAAGDIDRTKLREIKAREDAAFLAARPRSTALWARGRDSMPNGVPMSWLRNSYDHPPLFVAEGSGSHFRDADGIDYADFNIADMSMFGGYAPPPVVEAVARRVSQGTQFLLPNEDSLWVAEELARRYRLPKWQFTLSATAANTEAIRTARAITGRQKVLFFEGKYHGHFDDVLVVPGEDGALIPEEAGLPSNVTERTKLVPFNDPGALRAALDPRDVAIVITEPALTNNVGLLMPVDGFHAHLRAITRETGTLLAYDETHTQVFGPGGLTAMWGLEPDFVSAGKSIAGGVPFGAWGTTDEIAMFLTQMKGGDGERTDMVALGGTLFGNALSMAAARATMLEVLTPEAYEHTQRLGERLSAGMRASVERTGVPWYVPHLGPRAGYVFRPEPIRNAAEGRAAADEFLVRLIRIWLANRGVWEAIIGAGPVVPIPATTDDVDAYVDAWDSLLTRLTS
jgi:glutamate-1-semialdehyde 2,1-aminomutase